MTPDPQPAAPFVAKAMRGRLAMLVIALAVLVLLAIAWSWSPLRQWLDVDRVVAGLRDLGQAYGPVAATVAFGLALTLAVPLTFLTLVTVVALGPTAGFVCTLGGAMLGALASYGLGVALGRDVVRTLGGDRVNAVSQRLAQRGLLAVIAVRLVPVAPFAVVNMIAGASHISLRDLLLGTMLGMVPGTLAIAYFVDQILDAMKRPNTTSFFLIALTAILIVAGLWAARRWLRGVR